MRQKLNEFLILLLLAGALFSAGYFLRNFFLGYYAKTDTSRYTPAQIMAPRSQPH